MKSCVSERTSLGQLGLLLLLPTEIPDKWEDLSELEAWDDLLGVRECDIIPRGDGVDVSVPLPFCRDEARFLACILPTCNSESSSVSSLSQNVVAKKPAGSDADGRCEPYPQT